MGKVFVLGAFGYSNNQLDGQTVKTRNIFELLRKKYKGVTTAIDTLELKSHPLLLFKLAKELVLCKTVVLVPAESGIAVILPCLHYISKLFRFSIILACIGGWQIEFFNGKHTGKSHLWQMNLCKKIKAFLPEMVSVDNALKKEYGFKNTEVLVNFRDFDVSFNERNETSTLKIVFMARIQRKKGLASMFMLADYIIKNALDVTITFYGQISEEDKDYFLKNVAQRCKMMSYAGALKPTDIQGTISKYDVMLLPTQYYTEGLPGTVLDAYIAGIPVVVTEWKHAHEFVFDGKTGLIVPFYDGQKELNSSIERLSKDRALLKKMKKYAKEESEKYSYDAAWNVLSKYLNS